MLFYKSEKGCFSYLGVFSFFSDFSCFSGFGVYAERKLLAFVCRPDDKDFSLLAVPQRACRDSAVRRHLVFAFELSVSCAPQLAQRSFACLHDRLGCSCFCRADTCFVRA